MKLRNDGWVFLVSGSEQSGLIKSFNWCALDNHRPQDTQQHTQQRVTRLNFIWASSYNITNKQLFISLDVSWKLRSWNVPTLHMSVIN